jgi:uncharacterized protein YgiM (DUF1202 family)
LLATLVAGLWTPQAARAADFSAGDVVMATTSVNVRSSAGLDGTIRYTADPGDRFTVRDVTPVDEDGYTWYSVRTQTVANAGWVAGDFLALAGPFDAGDCAVVFDGDLNLRRSAGVGATIVAVLADGAGVRITDGVPVSRDGYLWYAVTSDGLSGWVVSAFLELRNCGSTDPDPVNGIGVGSTVRVADGPVNGRQAAGLNGRLIRAIGEGAIGWISAGPTERDGFTWYRFEDRRGSYWVAGEFLIVDPNIDLCGDVDPCPGDFEVGDDFEVVTNGLRLRERPGTNGRLIVTVPQGTVGVVVDERQAARNSMPWIKVRFAGYGTGWVARDFIAGI